MKNTLLRMFAALLCLSLLLPLLPASSHATETEATDLRGSTTITGTGYSSFGFLTDNNTTAYNTASGNASITLTNDSGMASLYLLFDRSYGEYTIRDTVSGAVYTAGSNGFLHEYIDLTAAFGTTPTQITLEFTSGKVRLSEIYVFGQGTLPAFVQRWSPPLERNTDLLLFATHGDDDQLFFAGLLPLYAGQLGYHVQVVYLTDHRSGYVDNARMHEMINGLWAVGITAYPVWGNFADFRIDSLQETYNTYKNSYHTTKDDLLGFVVEQIRRFKPLVAVGHDINGEYGHGMHMVYTDLVIDALELTGDPTAFPESAETYGTWQIQKLYLHLYEQNQIVLDYDQPLSAFDGMTAFQVTQKLGFPCHKSQQWTWFTTWLNGSGNSITSATQISTYNPCYFGLYYSAVGEDVQKNDFLENIITYGQQAQLDREAADSVSAMIAALTVSLNTGDQIAAARAAYEALTDTQKALVEKAYLLDEAETLYAQMVQDKQAQDEADSAAAAAVQAQIDELIVAMDQGNHIRAVRDAYNALTDTQKALVTNYRKLVEAEAQFSDLLLQEQERQEQLKAQELAEQQQIRLLIVALVVLIAVWIALLVVLYLRILRK